MSFSLEKSISQNLERCAMQTDAIYGTPLRQPGQPPVIPRVNISAPIV